MTKGTAIFAVLEDVHIEVYRTRDGGDKAKLVARVASLEFVGSRDRDAGGNQGDARPAQGSAPAPAAAPPDRRPAASTGSGFDDMDDDIPF